MAGIAGEIVSVARAGLIAHRIGTITDVGDGICSVSVDGETFTGIHWVVPVGVTGGVPVVGQVVLLLCPPGQMTVLGTFSQPTGG